MMARMGPVAQWDEAESEVGEVGHLGGTWTDLGAAAGSVTLGVNRIQVQPGKWSTPAHVELAEEEIHYVLGGSGISWQEGETYEIGEGDCLVHLVEEQTHTLRAGPGGLDVLAFGTRRPAGGTYLPRAGVIRMGPGNAAARADKHPWELEAEAGPPEVGEPTARPARIVALADAVPEQYGAGLVRELGLLAGSVLTGISHVDLARGNEGAPPHCHSAEEELFVVLAGDGVCILGEDEHPVRRGSVVSRPPATRVPHSFRAGDAGMTYLAYGTREPNDIVFYPRTRQVKIRGVGVSFTVPES
jgi:uncharacterized cupin superfamily protein